jgi:hypothetical protein
MPARESKGNNGFALNQAWASLQNHVLPLSPIDPRSPRQLLTTQEIASPNEAARALLPRVSTRHLASWKISNITNNEISACWEPVTTAKQKTLSISSYQPHHSLPTCVPTTGAHPHGLEIWTLFKTSLSCWTCKQLESLLCIN